MPKSMPAQQPGKSTQDVRTPKVFLDAVKLRLGIESFVVDLAASPANTVAKQFYSQRTNALVHTWVFPEGWCFCNPPFGKIEPWVKKAFHESLLGARIAMLLPAGVGSNWHRDWVHGKARILLLNGRIQFIGHTHGYPKDLMLLLYEPGVIPAYEIWTWMNEQRRAEATPADLQSAAFLDEIHVEPDSCILEFRTDEAGAECLAAGIVPRYVRERAREMLPLRHAREKVPA